MSAETNRPERPAELAGCDMPYPAHKAEDVFRHISVTVAGCWEWTGRRSRQGYGRYEIKNVVYAAHRIAWSVQNGPIPRGLFVCHRCDNPPCINPDHLFLGTPAENIRDAAAKGRLAKLVCPHGRKARGERIGGSKLRERDVLAIRRLRAAGSSLRELSGMFGVCEATISLAARGIIWTHLEGAIGVDA